MTAFFLGWKGVVKSARAEIEKQETLFNLGDTWAFIIRYITPATVFLVVGLQTNLEQSWNLARDTFGV